ncbi:hypothetical protein MKQ70_18025 [Chitinophaga sedimenti]|uniref:hypothetical protein n=1 Tax=Chitinophaga sedimenti TaxID=2033606 RepID=UPI0020046958|nr:hypothetical protein [Chitinophaga sedimenti]MCK7556813.1 hypothetical protein [Chitinophaga sedimenti]
MSATIACGARRWLPEQQAACYYHRQHCCCGSPPPEVPHLCRARLPAELRKSGSLLSGRHFMAGQVFFHQLCEQHVQFGIVGIRTQKRHELGLFGRGTQTIVMSAHEVRQSG